MPKPLNPLSLLLNQYQTSTSLSDKENLIVKIRGIKLAKDLTGLPESLLQIYDLQAECELQAANLLTEINESAQFNNEIKVLNSNNFNIINAVSLLVQDILNENSNERISASIKNLEKLFITQMEFLNKITAFRIGAPPSLLAALPNFLGAMKNSLVQIEQLPEQNSYTKNAVTFKTNVCSNLEACYNIFQKVIELAPTAKKEIPVANQKSSTYISSLRNKIVSFFTHKRSEVTTAKKPVATINKAPAAADENVFEDVNLHEDNSQVKTSCISNCQSTFFSAGTKTTVEPKKTNSRFGIFSKLLTFFTGKKTTTNEAQSRSSEISLHR